MLRFITLTGMILMLMLSSELLAQNNFRNTRKAKFEKEQLKKTDESNIQLEEKEQKKHTTKAESVVNKKQEKQSVKDTEQKENEEAVIAVKPEKQPKQVNNKQQKIIKENDTKPNQSKPIEKDIASIQTTPVIKSQPNQNPEKTIQIARQTSQSNMKEQDRTRVIKQTNIREEKPSITTRTNQQSTNRTSKPAEPSRNTQRSTIRADKPQETTRSNNQNRSTQKAPTAKVNSLQRAEYAQISNTGNAVSQEVIKETHKLDSIKDSPDTRLSNLGNNQFGQTNENNAYKLQKPNPHEVLTPPQNGHGHSGNPHDDDDNNHNNNGHNGHHNWDNDDSHHGNNNHHWDDNHSHHGNNWHNNHNHWFDHNGHYNWNNHHSYNNWHWHWNWYNSQYVWTNYPTYYHFDYSYYPTYYHEYPPHYWIVYPSFTFHFTWSEEIYEWRGFITENDWGTHNSHNRLHINYSPYISANIHWHTSFCPDYGYGMIVNNPNGTYSFNHFDRYGSRLAQNIINRYNGNRGKIYVKVRGYWDESNHTIRVVSMHRIRSYNSVAISTFYRPGWSMHRPHYNWFPAPYVFAHWHDRFWNFIFFIKY